jgi:hypothetical protein
MQGVFAWPFKVLSDLFRNSRSVPDPEFVPFKLGALIDRTGQIERPPVREGKSRLITIGQPRFVLIVWLIELLAVLVALIVLG